MMFFTPPPSGMQLPPKILAVFTYLEYAHRVRTGAGEDDDALTEGEEWKRGYAEGRKLMTSEARVYVTALDTLQRYFEEPGFGEMPPDYEIDTTPDEGPEGDKETSNA